MTAQQDVGAQPRERARVPIAELRGSDSPRLGGVDEEHARRIAELPDPLPPILVCRSTMAVLDGRHRLRAARLRGEDTVEVEFFHGDPDSGFLLAVRRNTLSTVDRKAAALRLVSTYPEWSDRRIAAAAGLSPKTIAAARANAPVPRRGSRMGLDGRVRPLDRVTGRLRAAELLASAPGSSLREVAAAAGISIGTAKDVRERVRLGQDPVGPRHREEEPAAARGFTDSLDLLNNLRRDPSLRCSEVGRGVLRLLGAHFLDRREWERFAEAVPRHCAKGMAQIARQCAEAWSDFADQVERRAARERW